MTGGEAGVTESQADFVESSLTEELQYFHSGVGQIEQETDIKQSAVTPTRFYRLVVLPRNGNRTVTVTALGLL